MQLKQFCILQIKLKLIIKVNGQWGLGQVRLKLELMDFSKIEN